MKDCPNCGLVNPSAAERCDCGYDFARRDGETPSPRYRWGNFVGIGSLLAVALYVSIAIDANRFAADFGSALLPRPLAILLAAVSAVAGFGILLRRRFGVIAYFVNSALALAFNLSRLTDQNLPENLKAGLGFGLLTGVPVAVVTFVYFGKRWRVME